MWYNMADVEQISPQIYEVNGVFIARCIHFGFEWPMQCSNLRKNGRWYVVAKETGRIILPPYINRAINLSNGF